MAPIQAGLLPEHLIIEIDSILSPVNPLNNDVRDLAGLLDFNVSEIQYINGKKYPFKYMLDQWCKREGDTATLEKLLDVLKELERPDVVELIDKAIKEVNNADYEKLTKLVTEHNQRMDKVDSIGFVALEEEKTSGAMLNDSYATNALNDDNEIACNNEKPLSAFIVYFPDSEDHVENIKEFVVYLRGKTIDAKLDLFETLSASESKQLYVLKNLRECDFVIVLCSSSMKLAYNLLVNKKVTPKLSEKMRELTFVLSFIISDLFRKKSIINKYIPVLLPGCKKSHIPEFLKTPKRYEIPKEHEALFRRIYQVEAIQFDTQKQDFAPRKLSQT